MLSLPTKGSAFECEAITLKHYDLNESDRILICFSKEYGLIRFIAKGVRRPKSKLAACVEPLRCVHIMGKVGKQLHRITQCSGVKAFSNIYLDYDVLISGLVMADLLQTFCPEMDAQPELYEFFFESLKLLNQTQEPRQFLIWFELQLLAHLGFAQNFENCFVCDTELKNQHQFFFHLLQGGFNCRSCADKTNTLYLSRPQFELMAHLQEHFLGAETVDMRSINRLQYLLQQYYQNLAEKEIKTLTRLHQDILQSAPVLR